MKSSKVIITCAVTGSIHTPSMSPALPVAAQEIAERVRPAAVWKPEVAGLNMGSMGLFPMLRRFREFKHEWGPQMLENSRDLVFRNSSKDIGYALNTLNEMQTGKAARGARG